ncbi:MAG: hypothetical protein KAV82_08010 [Phycisphaerae bacterium]|nr:hypothetical protein [Phycisphaerae bacterium]
MTVTPGGGLPGFLVIGGEGSGTFTQNGGTNDVTGDVGIGRYPGSSPDSAGTYTLSGNADLHAGRLIVGWTGSGIFTQTGGAVALMGSQDGSSLWIGVGVDADGRYEMSAGTLSVGGVCIIGSGGTGTFVMDGGTINGTTANARMIVNGSTGTLTGAGTFNIAVTYESPKLYGANGDQSVDVTFPPNGLTAGGSYDVTQLTPADFAGGTVIGLLPSSVFDVTFEGSFVGDFELAIPYDDDEVAALGASETELAVLRETGPETWELVNNLELDPNNDYIYIHQCAVFGRYAVVAPLQIVTVIVHGYQSDGTVPQWTYDMQNAIVDRTADSYAEIDVVVFDWADASTHGVWEPPPWGPEKASDVLKREAGRLVNELLLCNLVTDDPSCHVHLIGHSRGGSLVSYAAALLNRHFGRRVVNHMTILDGIDQTCSGLGEYLRDPTICGSGADWTDNYYSNDLFLHGHYRTDADYNIVWDYPHGGFAERYTQTIINTGSEEGYYWSLGGGGWLNRPRPGRAPCSQWEIETVINGDFETEDLLSWSAPLGTPSVVPHGPDNYVCEMEEQSSVAISQSIITAAHARFLLFDFAFTVPGDGDYLTVTLGGTTIFTFLGTDFESSDLVSSGPIDISAFAGQTSCELVFTLDSVGEPGATVLLDSVEVIVAGDLDFDGDADLDDYVNLADCLGGPGVTAPPDGCSPEQFTVADVDGDEDVDLADYASFGVWFTGSPPGLLGDADGDGDVDLADFAFLPDCLTGPDNPPYSQGCEAFDFDYDGDLDLYDFAAFQAAFTGP